MEGWKQPEQTSQPAARGRVSGGRCCCRGPPGLQQRSAVGQTSEQLLLSQCKRRGKKGHLLHFMHSETLLLPSKCILDPVALGLFCSLGALKVCLCSGKAPAVSRQPEREPRRVRREEARPEEFKCGWTSAPRLPEPAARSGGPCHLPSCRLSKGNVSHTLCLSSHLSFFSNAKVKT